MNNLWQRGEGASARGKIPLNLAEDFVYAAATFSTREKFIKPISHLTALYYSRH